MKETLEIEQINHTVLCLVEGELFGTVAMLIFLQNLLCIRGGKQL